MQLRKCWAIAIYISSISLVSAEVTEVVSGSNIFILPSNNEYDIQESLGQVQGNNLFHDFNQFNINTGETAVFSGSSNIQNIISRVSGGNSSTIDGTLRSTISGANLWLLNPNGILFGENARLDLTGSFYTSTADYLKFDNNDQYFSAGNSENSIASVATPLSFGFTETDSSFIIIDKSKLSVSGNRSIYAVGGAINVFQSELTVENGEIQLVANQSVQEIDLSSLSSIEISAADYADLNINESTIVASGAVNQGVSIIGGKILIADSKISEQSTENNNQSKIILNGELMVLSNTSLQAFDQSTIQIQSDQLVVRDVNAIENTGIVDASLTINKLNLTVENENTRGLDSLLNSIDDSNVLIEGIKANDALISVIDNSADIDNSSSQLPASLPVTGSLESAKIRITNTSRKKQSVEFDLSAIDVQDGGKSKNPCHSQKNEVLVNSRTVLFQPMPNEFNPGIMYTNIDLTNENVDSANPILRMFNQCG